MEGAEERGGLTAARPQKSPDFWSQRALTLWFRGTAVRHMR